MKKSLYLLLSLFLFSCNSLDLKTVSPPPSKGEAKTEGVKPKSLKVIQGKEELSNVDSVMAAGERDLFENYPFKPTRKITTPDFSGVAFADEYSNRPCTLITRQHVLMARHFPRDQGTKVVFYTPDNKRVERTIVRTVSPWVQPGYYQPDICVGLLDKRVPSSLAVYPIFPPEVDGKQYPYNEYLDNKVILLDQRRQINIYAISRISFGEKYDEIYCGDWKNVIDDKWNSDMIARDSGHPTFALYKGQLVLMSTHLYGGRGATGPFLSGKTTFDLLQSLVTSLNQ